MTLRKSRVNHVVDMLTYTCRTFSIRTGWDGGTHFTIEVYDDVDKLLESQEVRGDVDKAEVVFEELKTKYILK
jgi:hypothetical protein